MKWTKTARLASLCSVAFLCTELGCGLLSPPAEDAPHDGGHPALTCSQIVTCEEQCAAGSDACLRTCDLNGTFSAQHLAGALASCLGSVCPTGVGGVCATLSIACFNCEGEQESGPCAEQFVACQRDGQPDAGQASDSDAGSFDAGPPDAGLPSFARDVAPLMTQFCATCHATGTNGAPLDQFTDYATAVHECASIRAYIVGNLMPLPGSPQLYTWEEDTIINWCAEPNPLP
jgi:hypothetical protein